MSNEKKKQNRSIDLGMWHVFGNFEEVHFLEGLLSL